MYKIILNKIIYIFCPLVCILLIYKELYVLQKYIYLIIYLI